jgi:hypothetical protein
MRPLKSWDLSLLASLLVAGAFGIPTGSLRTMTGNGPHLPTA